MRPARALVVLGGLLCGGCIGPFSLVSTTETLSDRGQFDPSQTGFAVVDRTTSVDGGAGAARVVDRPEPRVAIFLSGARFDPEEDLAALPAAAQEDLLHQVRRTDVMVLENLPLSLLSPNNQLSAAQPNTPSDQFTFVLQRGNVGFRRNQTYADVQPFGSNQVVTAQASGVNTAAFGRLEFSDVTVNITQGANQPDSATVATGRIIMRVSVPVLPERLAESNLRFLRQALRTP